VPSLFKPERGQRTDTLRYARRGELGIRSTACSPSWLRILRKQASLAEPDGSSHKGDAYERGHDSEDHAKAIF